MLAGLELGPAACGAELAVVNVAFILDGFAPAGLLLAGRCDFAPKTGNTLALAGFALVWAGLAAVFAFKVADAEFEASEFEGFDGPGLEAPVSFGAFVLALLFAINYYY